jgi:uncharacterized protein (TIGR02147 family)
MTIFEFDEYKPFFRELIRAKGTAGRGEYRRMAELLNVHPTMISQILSGDKEFTAEQIVRLAKHYGFGRSEIQYLIILVDIARSGSVELKKELIEIKNEMQKKSLQLSNRIQSTKELTDHQKAVFYSSWIYSAIQISTSLNRIVDFDFICKRFQLSPERVREVLDFLKESGLITEQSGNYKPGIKNTHLSKGSPFTIKHHSNWRVKALEKSEILSDEELMYSVNFSLSRADFKRLREHMVEFIQNFLKTVHASPEEDVAQFNLDFFWL